MQETLNVEGFFKKNMIRQFQGVRSSLYTVYSYFEKRNFI